MFISVNTNTPNPGDEVVVKLASGHYGIAEYDGEFFYPAHVLPDDDLRFSDKVISWRPIDCLER